MKQLTGCFLFAIASLALQAQHAVSGYVVSNGQPLAGVTIVISSGKKGTITNGNGYFRLGNIADSSISLHFSAVGYAHAAVHYVLHKGENPLPLQELTPTAGNLESVVISGTMKAISKTESPIPVEVYTPALFKKNPSPNLFESLQMVNGIQPQINCNVCNTGDIHINGMEGPYTMVLIDGMPIVSSLSTVYGLSGIPMGMIKRIEVVKGPASTLYGSEAVGGLINIITKDPSKAEKLKADISVSSMQEYNMDLNLKLGLKKTSSLVGLNLFHFGQKYDINHDNFTDVTLQKRWSLFNKWNIYRASNRVFSVALRYFAEDRWGGQLQWTKQHRGSDSIYGESISTNRFEVIANYGLPGDMLLDFSYNYHHQDSYYGTTKYDAVQQVAFTQVRRTFAFGRHSLLVGTPFRFTAYDDNTPATAGVTGGNQPSLVFLPGIFAQDEWKQDRLTILAGLRYDYDHRHGNIFTPRLSFKYTPMHNHTIRLSSGSGYRVVNLFTEDHAALTGARQVVIAEKLQPERSWNINLNYAALFKMKQSTLNIDASIFYTRFTNKILGDFNTDVTRIIYQNLEGFAVSKGVSLNTDLSIGRFKMNAGTTLMDVYTVNKDATGKPSRERQLFAPSFTATYALSYVLKTWTLDVTGRINGAMRLPTLPNDLRPEYSPLYGIVNMQLTRVVKEDGELYCGVKNLLNFIPQHAILHADDPFNRPGGKYFDNNGQPRTDSNPRGYVFDPAYNYAAVQGTRFFVGVRWSIK